VNGWLVLDKPLGITSAQAVAAVKRIVTRGSRIADGQKRFANHEPRTALKIGHAGTLDPLASGILPLALGEATKTVQYAFATSKAYAFTVTWGERRDTDDAEGKVVETRPIRHGMSQIVTLLPAFTGKIMQVPPAYAAVKVEGNRAYALARAGQEVRLNAREVCINRLELVDSSAESARFVTECGKGTYIRSLARDMALALGTVGYVSALRRTRVGCFGEEDAISLENLEKMVHNGTLRLHPVESVLDDIPAREIDSASAQRLRLGQSLPHDGEGLVRARCNGELIAICNLGGGKMKPVRVFNL
jgi:tRNA pseudouridine55 synthase